MLKPKAKIRLTQRQEHDLALSKAATLAVQGNSYLREIAKSDPSLARAIESAERDNAAMGAPDEDSRKRW